MHCNVPRLGQLVGVEVTVTVTMVVIIINSGDAVSTHEGDKQQLSPKALATISGMLKSGLQLMSMCLCTL